VPRLRSSESAARRPSGRASAPPAVDRRRGRTSAPSSRPAAPPGRATVAARVVLGLGVLLGFQWAGTWVVDATHAPVPGSVVGMLLLAAALALDVLPVALVRDAASLLVRHLTLLFIPGGAALLLHGDVVRRAWLPVTIAALASLALVLLVVGRVAQALERR
jgi:holin-like protein